MNSEGEPMLTPSEEGEVERLLKETNILVEIGYDPDETGWEINRAGPECTEEWDPLSCQVSKLEQAEIIAAVDDAVAKHPGLGHAQRCLQLDELPPSWWEDSDEISFIGTVLVNGTNRYVIRLHRYRLEGEDKDRYEIGTTWIDAPNGLQPPFVLV